MNNYQRKAQETSQYPGKKDGHVEYSILGLLAAGGKLAKVAHRKMRGQNHDPEDVKHLLGNALWYVQEIACQFDLFLGEVADYNLAKLQDKTFTPFED